MRALVIGTLVLALGCTPPRCKKGTAFLSYALPPGAEAATSIEVSFTRGTATQKQSSMRRAGEGSTGAFEVDFDAYPAGEMVTFTLTALDANSKPLAASSPQAVTLNADCASLSFSLASLGVSGNPAALESSSRCGATARSMRRSEVLPS
jgi:hypothetical protein